MIVGRGHGAVGEWWFEAREPAEPAGLATLRTLLHALETVAQILESAELLRARRLTFSGWLTGTLEGNDLRRVERPDVEVALDGAADGLAERALAALPAKDAYPVDASLTGTGVLLDESDRPQEHEDVSWLAGRTIDHHIVIVGVQSDAFLQWSVDGNEQTEIWRRNAPRLEGALRMVRDVLGVDPWTESTPHAHIDGFTLRNRRDVDGEVVPTLETPS